MNSIKISWRTSVIDALKANKPNAIAMGPFGSNIKTDNFVKKGVPVIRGTNLTNGKFNLNGFVYLTEDKADELRSSNVFPGDLVFTHRGTLGQVGLIPEKPYPRYVVSQSQMKLSVNKSIIDPTFLYYYFLAIGNKELLKHVAGAGVPAIANPLTTLKKLTIKFPNLSVQSEIVKIMSSLDEKIELNNKIAKTLEEMAQAIFKEWFIHFRFPGYELQHLNNSLPNGWEIKTLSTIATITMGQSPSSKSYNTEGLGLPFHQGVTNFGERFPTHEIFCTENTRIAEARDILFSVRAPVGRMNFANTKISLGRGVASIRHKKGYQSFLYYQLRNIFKKEDVIGSGSVFPAVTKKDMEEIKFLAPETVFIEKFEALSSRIDKKIEFIYEENKKLMKIRVLLLPKLMNGEVSV